MLFPALEVGLDLFNIVYELGVGADPEAQGLEILEHFPVGVRDGAFGVTEAVDKDVQGSLGGDTGVELADGAGGGVSRVDVKRLTGLLPLAVKLFKAAEGHVDLAAYFEAAGAIGRDGQRDGVDGAKVLGDILAAKAVTPGRATD